MQPLQSPTRLAGRLDRFGLLLLAFILCCGWFYYLWGSIVPALPAGIALTVLLAATARLGEQRTLARREAQLRRRICGEMAVDSLLLQPESSAVANVAAWLSGELALQEFQPRAHGMRARLGEQSVWIACLQRHAGSRATCDDVLACVRAARREKADVCIVCATCAFCADAVALSSELSPKTRLLGRSGLMDMAGAAAPATDEQLRALGRRRRKQFRRELWQARVFEPRKARRYGAYGLGLLAMYLLLRQMVYLIPALVCLALFVVCRCRRQRGSFTL